MSDDNLLTRREFTLEWALAVLAGATITITGCGDDDDAGTNPSPQPPPAGSEIGAVSANHGHSVFITQAQLTAGGALALDIRGTATHPHTISLTAAQVGTIAANQQVSVVSTTDDGHNHTVTFN
jgi:VCBS repeat-containing protein